MFAFVFQALLLASAPSHLATALRGEDLTHKEHTERVTKEVTRYSRPMQEIAKAIPYPLPRLPAVCLEDTSRSFVNLDHILFL